MSKHVFRFVNSQFSFIDLNNFTNSGTQSKTLVLNLVQKCISKEDHHRLYKSLKRRE